MENKLNHGIKRVIGNVVRRTMSLADLDAAMDAAISGRSVTSGVSVSETTALNYLAYFSCINILSQDISSLPLTTYKRLARGKEKAYNYYLYRLLHDAPNPNMTSAKFRMDIQGHALSWGNGYAFIDWGRNGDILALWPLNPSRITPTIKDGNLTYVFRKNDGTDLTYQKEQILHIPGLGFDGITGYSVVKKIQEAVGLGMATEQFGASFFGNGAKLGGVLEHPTKLSDPAYKRLKESWKEAYQGAAKGNQTAILEEGTKYNQLGIPPEDAQFLQTRTFQVEEMARVCRIPLMLLQVANTTTYASAEQFMLSYKTLSLTPWLVRWEQALNQKCLITEREQREYFIEHQLDGLMRGDAITRGTFYTQMFQLGALSPNDIREIENHNPIEGGDEYFVQLNMVPLKNADKVQEPVEEAPTEEPDEEPEEEPVEGKKSLEVRATPNRLKIAKNKLTVVNSYRSVFNDAASRVVKREVQDITKALKKDGFREWLDEYYTKQPEVIRSIMAPAFMGLGEAVQKCAAEECGGKIGMSTELTECINTHIDLTAKFNANAAKGRLLKVMGEAEGTRALVPELLKTAVMNEIAGWADVVPSMMTGWELTRTSGLISKATYFYSGVKDIEWVTVVDEQCTDLDGVSRSISANCRSDAFVAKNRAMSVCVEHRVAKDFTPTWNVVTPPLFNGCTCQIIPRIGR